MGFSREPLKESLAMSNILWNDEPEKPLQHLRIVDLTVMLPGPFLTRLLAQYGADVVKIEALPHGDPLRTLPQSAAFELMNQGKRSMALDLKQREAIEFLHQLIVESDVFVENFRDGVMDALGLGYAELSEKNPDLLYLSLRGFAGEKGKKAGHDLNFIAASGVGDWWIENGIPNYSSQFGDIVGGMMVPAMKLLSHLANPARRGMHLISNMDEGFRTLYLGRAFDAFKAESLGEDKRADFGTQASMDGTYPHSRFYRCRDGQWVALNTIQEKHWTGFCEVVDRAAWKDRMWDKELVAEIETLFLDAPASYWETLVAERDICLNRVVPWTEHLGFSQARPQLATDPLTWAGFLPNETLRPTPVLGGDTFAVLHGMGISNKKISEGMQKSAFFQADNQKIAAPTTLPTTEVTPTE